MGEWVDACLWGRLRGGRTRQRGRGGSTMDWGKGPEWVGRLGARADERVVERVGLVKMRTGI